MAGRKKKVEMLGECMAATVAVEPLERVILRTRFPQPWYSDSLFVSKGYMVLFE
jgi:hypothetical protein